MPFSKTQQEAIDIRDMNVVVSASAGSGKTSVLVERLCQLVITSRISIDRILAMTFTNDAAAEMKTRLKNSLQNIQKKNPSDIYIQNQLTLLETASISTIDSFCQTLVKNYYYKIPISYTMAQTVGTSAQLKKAMETAYQNAINQIDLDDLVELNLFFNAYGQTSDEIQKIITSIINVANSKANKEEWYQSIIDSYSNIECDRLDYFFDYFLERIEAMINIIEYMLNEIEYIEFKKEKDYLKTQALFSSKLMKLKDCIPYLLNKDYNTFRMAFKTYITSTPNMPGTIGGIKFKEGAEFKAYQDSITSCLFDLDTFKKDLLSDSSIINTLIQICKNTELSFAKEKQRLEIIDFNDMEHFALKLLNNESIQDEIRNKYITILVDEFQDTNELQETIISKFCRKNNVFRVGDIKQSIYGFRQANPKIMINHMNSESEYDKTLVLKENYRSNESIVQFNNDFYSKIMNTELLGSQFSDIDIANVGRKEQIETDQYPIRFLYTEQDSWAEEQEEKINSLRIDSIHNKNRYDIIANDILRQIEKGKKYSDICILLRSHTKENELKECLESYGIPVFARITSGYFTNPAVQIALSCLNSLVNPNDDIHLVAALCSPIFDISYQQIARACYDKPKNSSLWMHIKDCVFMKEYSDLYRNKPGTIIELLKIIYSYNDFYYFHTTSQDKVNLDYLLEKGTVYENQTDIIGFISLLEEESKLDKTGEASSVGKEENVVRIMTMHGSKGLQFPIVYILSNHSTNKKFDSGPVLVDAELGVSLGVVDIKNKCKRPSIYQLAHKTKKIHDELLEEMRVLYVATTRAEKELIFVDTIKNEKEYSYPLNTRALLNRKSYTSWVFHTYLHTDSLVQFHKINSLYQTPEKAVHTNNSELQIYTKDCESLSSQTASASKQKLDWDPFETTISKATIRGTLFHEMAGQCSFPYQEKEIIEFAKNLQYDMKPSDLSQFLSLNNDKDYVSFMNHPHQFELSYIVQEGQSVVHGFMDLVVELEDKVIILDFKTDSVSTPQELIDKYHKQLETYKESYLKIDSSKPIEMVLYSFHLKQSINIHQ